MKIQRNHFPKRPSVNKENALSKNNQARKSSFQ